MQQIIESPHKNDIGYYEDLLENNTTRPVPSLENNQKIGVIEDDNTECVQTLKHRADELQRLLNIP